MSSPVQIGTVVASCSWRYCSVYCQGITSSSQAGTYFSIRLRQADAVLQRDVADMVDGERNLVADDLADFGDVLLEQVEALFGEMQAGEGVADVVRRRRRRCARAGPRCVLTGPRPGWTR